ncbi:MAG: hypothetical protein IH859_09885 [Chloroflexi bacterium]|nr:hypothetical protein [Chloroflexota bacterium]
MKMIRDGELSSRAAKDILELLVTKGGDPREIAEMRGLFQKSDTSELETVVEKIIKEKINKKYFETYKDIIKFLK